MPRFAANLSLLFTELPLAARFGAAARAGFDAVELQFPYALSPPELAASLNASGLNLVLFNAPAVDYETRGERGLAALPGRERDFQQSLLKALDYASVSGCPRLHVMSGLVQQGANRSTLIENLRWACPLAEAAGVKLLLEPINGRDFPGYLLQRTMEATAVIGQVGGDNLRLQFDLYHRQIMEGDLLAALGEYLPLIEHVQIAQPPDRGEPDMGEIHYRTVLEALDRLGYRGWVGCEYRPRGGTVEGLGWMDAYRPLRHGPD
jgi:hydroxypyruvate isomerase